MAATRSSRLRNCLRVIFQIAFIALFFVAVYFAYNIGASSGKAQGSAGMDSGKSDAATVSRAPADQTIWTCSMHPQIRMTHPGECPICGMDLVPAKDAGSNSASTSGTAAQIKAEERKPVGYACAMNCVPPLPNPGKCPVCGMDMVPVYDQATGEGGGNRRYTMSEDARALAEIEVTPVERKWVTNEVRMVGLIDYDETRLSFVTAYVSGRLDRLFVDYTGTLVRKGDHMVSIYSPELLTAQEELIQAKAAYENVNTNAIPSVREASRKALEAVRERLRLWGLTPEQIRGIEDRGAREDHVTLYATRGGVVIKRLLQEGDYVRTGERIYTVADLSDVWVKLKAYEADLAWLRYGQEVKFAVEAYPGEQFSGRISFIDPVLDPMTRTVNVRVNVSNEDGRLKPGMFVSASAYSRLMRGGRVIEPDLAHKWICPMHPEIVKDTKGQCDICGMDLVPVSDLGFAAAEETTPPLVIPASAPLITGTRAVVYVEVPGQEDPTYEGREITLGPRAGSYYIVPEGLREGELVVTHGEFKIDSALQILAKPSMMSPPAGGDHSMQDHDHGGESAAGTSPPSDEVRR